MRFLSVDQKPLVEGGWLDRNANAAGGTDLENVSGASVATVGSDRDVRPVASLSRQLARVAKGWGCVLTGLSVVPRLLGRGPKWSGESCTEVVRRILANL